MKYIPIFLSLLLFSNCNSKKKSIEYSDNSLFNVLVESPYGGNDEQHFTVIRSSSELKAAIADVFLEEEVLKNLNEIDFNTKDLLSLHLGTRNTGGFGIEVSNVEVKGNTTYVSIIETKPKPGEMVTMALTQPYSLVLINKNENIVFNFE